MATLPHQEHAEGKDAVGAAERRRQVDPAVARTQKHAGNDARNLDSKIVIHLEMCE